MDAALLDDRNAAWVPVIEAASARAPRLVVAAGAAHLPGEKGILAALAARGWTVEPLDEAACCGACGTRPAGSRDKAPVTPLEGAPIHGRAR